MHRIVFTALDMLDTLQVSRILALRRVVKEIGPTFTLILINFDLSVFSLSYFLGPSTNQSTD